ncbi:MAG: glycosyltransferase [Candidatus Omnitrophica bacterium]|nr:glycosyltransferase [Candidatus Omnitrophota bacterium]
MTATKKVKILHLITELEPGGAENLLLSLSENMFIRGFDVCIGYLKGKGTLAEDFKKSGIKVIHFNMRSRFDIFCLLRLSAFITNEKFDIVHTHLIDADIFGYFGTKIAGVSCIVSTKHNTDDFRKRKTIPMLLDSFVSNHLSKNIAVSNSVREFLIKYQSINPKNIEVVYNGIDILKFLPKKSKEQAKIDLKLNDKDYVVGTIARFDKQKGYKYLIKAIPLILQNHKNVHFVLVGEGSLKNRISEMVVSMGLKDKVTFLGVRNDIPEILNALDILVLPSLWEGLGMVLLEAQAAGIVTVASDIDGIKEVIGDEKTGMLIPPADEKSLAQKVTTLIENESLRNLLIAQAKESVKEKFNIEVMTDKIESIYKKLLK